MNLSKKTFLYSMCISVMIVAFMVGYFILMVPSLYVDYVQNQHYESILETHQCYLKDRTYQDIKVKNPAGALTLEIPKEGNEIYLTGKYFRASVRLQDEALLNILQKTRTFSVDQESMKEVELSDDEQKEFTASMERIFGEILEGEDAAFRVELEGEKDAQAYKQLSEEIHIVSDSIYIYEGSVTDGVNYYTSYMAFSKVDGVLICSFLPVMTPQIDEIQPIIFKSLPMIAAVAFFIMLVASQIFSRTIVNPIIRLARYAQNIDMNGTFERSALEIKGKDEVSDLGHILNELYEKLQQNYRELKQKNVYLVEENKRHEVFLRASSHQLKTPIAAALLLVEGMIGEVGKYKDTKTYLPQVKSQLQSIKKIVEDILYLNHCADHLEIERIDMKELVLTCMESYRIAGEAKALEFCIQGSMERLPMDREIMIKIVDNLLSNAVRYTPVKKRVDLVLDGREIRIQNYGGHIPEELLPHVLEPFVTSNDREKGHGLGLYVAAYYAELLGWKMEVRNTERGVEAVLSYIACAPDLHTKFI